ncbi:MAG: hypothetical protein GX230_03585 [Lentisphaerae bacterium]|jgi:lysophospholipase L1-like esterase|nr:hypothetical protein [Lentisphaerota bacterium]
MAERKIEDMDTNFKQAAPVADEKGIVWRAPTDGPFEVRGLWWYKENDYGYSRLPKRAEQIVRPDVWSLGQCPASGRVCFRTDSTMLALRHENSRTGNMVHFAITGSDGLFVYEGEPLLERPWNMSVPYLGGTAMEKEIVRDMPRRMRTFTVYLPLYAPLSKIEIGLDAEAVIEAPPPCRLDKPIVFYGTSITQGGCASTAGGDFVSAVGRKLNLDVINLGFSGNGRGEPEMAHLIAEIDAAAFVLDYCANTTVNLLDETLPVFIDILRQKHPETPIICMSKIHYYGEVFNAAGRINCEKQRDVMIRHYIERRGAGDNNIHFIDGWSLVGAGEDMALVDGVHPTSQGFAIMAERLVAPLRHVLDF